MGAQRQVARWVEGKPVERDRRETNSGLYRKAAESPEGEAFLSGFVA
jgi:hypothetical protein